MGERDKKGESGRDGREGRDRGEIGERERRPEQISYFLFIGNVCLFYLEPH